MILTLLSIPALCEALVDGGQISITNTTVYQVYSYEQKLENSMINLFFSLKGSNSTMHFYICKQTNNCYLNKTDQFHELTSIEYSQYKSIDLPKGTYNFVFKCLFTNCDTTIQVGSGLLLQNRYTHALSLQNINGTYVQQFYYYSCSNESLTLSLTNNLTYSITSDPSVSFNDLLNCKDTQNTTCNQKSETVNNVNQGIYKILISYPRASDVTVIPSQGNITEFDLNIKNYINRPQSLSGLCGVFYKLILKNDQSFTNLTLVPISDWGVVGVSKIAVSNAMNFSLTQSSYYGNVTFTKNTIQQLAQNNTFYVHTQNIIMQMLETYNQINMNQTLFAQYDIMLPVMGTTLVLKEPVDNASDKKVISVSAGYQLYFEFAIPESQTCLSQDNCSLQQNVSVTLLHSSVGKAAAKNVAFTYINGTEIPSSQSKLPNGFNITEITMKYQKDDAHDFFILSSGEINASEVWLRPQIVNIMPMNVEFELSGNSVSGTYNFYFNLTEDDRNKTIVIEATSDKQVDLFVSLSNPGVDNIHFSQKASGSTARIDLKEIDSEQIYLMIDTHNSEVFTRVSQDKYASQVLNSGEAKNFSIKESSKQVEIMWVSTNDTQIDQALLKIAKSNANVNLNYLVSTTPIAQSSKDGYLINGTIPGGKNETEITFKTQHMGTHYIQLTADSPISAEVQVVPLIELQNNILTTLTPNHGNYAYVRYLITNNQQASININLVNAQNIDLWQFDYAMPFSNALNTNDKTTINTTYQINNIDKIGYHYLIFNMSQIAAQNDQGRILVTIQQNHLGAPGQRSIIKMDGDQYKFATIDFGVNISEKQSIVFNILKCDNCAGCLSFTIEQPSFQRFNTNLSESDCDMIIGNSSTADEYKQVNMIPGVGKRYAYVSFQSLGRLGEVEQIDYLVDYIHIVDLNQSLNVTLVPLGQERAANVSKFSSAVILECSQQSNNINYTFMVSPCETGRSAYHQAYYSVYFSFWSPFPSITNNFMKVVNGNGLVSLELNYTIIQQICENPADKMPLFFTVEASSELATAMNVSTILTNNQNIVSHVIGVANDSIMLNAPIKEKRIATFNAQVLPINIIISPCYGSIRYRAGITNFFVRTNFSESDLGNESVIVQPQQVVGHDITLTIQKGSRYSATGMWYLELSDYNQNSTDPQVTNRSWEAEVFVGVQDIRPGIPVRKIAYGHRKNGNKLVVRVANAIPKGLGTEQIEYGMFILAEALVNDGSSIYYNPNASCAYKAGLQIMKYTEVYSANSYYQEFEQDVNGNVIKQYLADHNNGKSTVYLTIIARQPSTGLSNLYNAELVDLAKIPELEDLTTTKLNVGAIVGSVVAIIVAVVVIIVMIIVFLKKKKQNPYQQM